MDSSPTQEEHKSSLIIQRSTIKCVLIYEEVSKAPQDEKKASRPPPRKDSYFLFIYDSSSKTEKGIPPGGGLSGFWLGMGPRNSLEVNDVN